MLIVSKTRYVPTAVNMTILQGSDDLFYYVHRSLYDQCVVLDDLYASKPEMLYRQLGIEDGTAPEVCERFTAALPRPLNVLVPFLLLVSGYEELDTVEDVCGALSSMSMSLDFRRLFKVPPAVRSSIKFSLSVREEYKVQWDRFFQETPTLDQVSYSQHREVPVAAPVSTAPVTVVSEDDDDDFDPEAIMAAMRERDAAFMEDSSPTTFTHTEEDTEEEEAAEEEKPVSGFSLLKGML